MKDVALRVIVHDTIATVFARIVDFITPDGAIVSHETVLINRGLYSDMMRIVRIANDTGIMNLSNGDSFRVVDSRILSA